MNGIDANTVWEDGVTHGWEDATETLRDTIRARLADSRARLADHPGLYTALYLIDQMGNTAADTQPIERVT